MYKIKKIGKRHSIYSNSTTVNSGSRSTIVKAHIAHSIGRQVSNDIRNISNNMLYSIAKANRV